MATATMLDVKHNADMSLADFAQTQLLIAINDAREAAEQALLNYQQADMYLSDEAYAIWREAHIRHKTLSEAGLIISIGYTKE